MGRCLALVAVLAACGDNFTVDDRAGGDPTIDDRTETAFSHPAPDLTEDQQGQHHAGEGQFEFQWEPPSSARSSTTTVQRLSRRRRPRPGADRRAAPSRSQALVRVSLPAGQGSSLVPGGPVPVPGFGLAAPGSRGRPASPEVNIALTWTEMAGSFGDGTTFSLRAPDVDVKRPTAASSAATRCARTAPRPP